MKPDTNCPDRAHEGIEHLQAAARELIQAARALLDVAEELIDDPAAIATLAGALGAMGDAARRRITATPEDNGESDGESDGEGGGERDDDGDGTAVADTTIERITVA